MASAEDKFINHVVTGHQLCLYKIVGNALHLPLSSYSPVYDYRMYQATLPLLTFSPKSCLAWQDWVVKPCTLCVCVSLYGYFHVCVHMHVY